MEKLEKQLEVEFMEEEKCFKKYMGSVPEMLTAVTSIAWLSYLILYTSCPKCIDSIQNYIKSLF